MRRRLFLLVLLLGQVPGAQAQPDGAGVDCHAAFFPDAVWRSLALGDGRYLYQMELANRGHAAVRYSYSFILPGSTRPAEALNGYLTPGARVEHALGTGDRNLSPAALRAETRLRCFPL